VIVLGIDPGTASTGWGVVEYEGNRLRSRGHGCIVTSAKDPSPVRLRRIYDEARSLLRRFHPDVVAIEELFVNVNVKTALAVGQARGVLILAVADLAQPPFEYSPLQIKMSVTGQGPGAGDDQDHPPSAAHPAPGPRRRRPGGSHLPRPPGQYRSPAVARSRRREGPMIASVSGVLTAVEGERAVVEVGGFGLEVLASGRTLGSLAPHVGEHVELHTYLNVRQDALQLFGFRETRERTFFLWLTAVSGVGPKVALAVLSGYPVAELELAVARDDVKKFESIPGIGKKLAQRLVVELKDKVGELPPAAADLGGPGVPVGARFIEARSALQNLGLTLREAEEALRGAPDDAPVEDLVKFALTRKAVT